MVSTLIIVSLDALLMFTYSHKVFETSNIAEGLKKSHQIIANMTNYSAPYHRMWETAIDLIVIAIPNPKLKLRSVIDIPGLTEINFRANKIIRSCENIDIVVFVGDGNSACTIQDIQSLETYNIINDVCPYNGYK